MGYYKATEIIATRNGYEWAEGWRCDEYSGYLLHKIGKWWTVTDVPTGYMVKSGFGTREEAFKALPGLQEKLNLFFAQNPDHYNKLVHKKEYAVNKREFK